MKPSLPAHEPNRPITEYASRLNSLFVLSRKKDLFRCYIKYLTDPIGKGIKVVPPGFQFILSFKSLPGLFENMENIRKSLRSLLSLKIFLPSIPPDHDVMKGSGRINSGSSEHERSLNPIKTNINF